MLTFRALFGFCLIFNPYSTSGSKNQLKQTKLRVYTKDNWRMSKIIFESILKYARKTTGKGTVGCNLKLRLQIDIEATKLRIYFKDVKSLT